MNCPVCAIIEETIGKQPSEAVLADVVERSVGLGMTLIALPASSLADAVCASHRVISRARALACAETMRGEGAPRGPSS